MKRKIFTIILAICLSISILGNIGQRKTINKLDNRIATLENEKKNLLKQHKNDKNKLTKENQKLKEKNDNLEIQNKFLSSDLKYYEKDNKDKKEKEELYISKLHVYGVISGQRLMNDTMHFKKDCTMMDWYRTLQGLENSKLVEGNIKTMCNKYQAHNVCDDCFDFKEDQSELIDIEEYVDKELYGINNELDEDE